MKDWYCGECGQEVLAKEKPQPIKWTDGHVCSFTEVKQVVIQTCFNCGNEKCRDAQINIHNMAKRHGTLHTYLNDTTCDDWEKEQRLFDDVGDGTMTSPNACK
jgi:hypothetical protein